MVVRLSQPRNLHPHIIVIQSSVCLRVHTCWCTSCGFSQMYDSIHPPLHYHSVILLLKHPLCSMNSSLSQLTPDLFIVSKVLPFPECCIVGIICCVAFSDKLLLFREQYTLQLPSSLHGLIAHLFLERRRFCCLVYHSFFIHSPLKDIFVASKF
jgi:hypothetical protein